MKAFLLRLEVLILVLVEHTLGDLKRECARTVLVLILVLVEHTLGDTSS